MKSGPLIVTEEQAAALAVLLREWVGGEDLVGSGGIQVVKAGGRTSIVNRTRRKHDGGNWERGDRLLAVLVVQDGGLAGSGTEACTFTYTVKNREVDGSAAVVMDKVKGSHALDATAMTPEMARPALGLTTAATIGLALYDAGNLVLWWVDEVPATVKRVCV